MEPFEDVGLWWLPGFESNKIAGTISYNKSDGITLNLIGRLEPDGTEESQDAVFYEFNQINGIVKKKKFITLRECQVMRFSNGTLEEQDFICGFAFVGYRNLLPVESLFSAMGVTYSSLLNWLNKSGFDRSWKLDERQLQSYNVSYQRPDELKFPLEDSNISIGISMSTHGTINSTTINESAYILVELNKPLLLRDWLNKYVAPLQNFFSLASGYPNSVTELDIKPSLVDEVKNSNNKITGDRFFELLYQPVSRTPSHIKNCH